MQKGDGSVVALGTSAGGLAALETALSTLPATFPWPILVTQHMDPHHASHIADILARSLHLKVKQAESGEALEAGTVYTSPSESEMGVSPQGQIVLRARPAARGRPQGINFLFKSVAAAYGEHAVAIVLSGTGTDGAAGALSIKKGGGLVIAESDETAQHTGMPNAAIQVGAVDLVQPAGEIGLFLDALARGETTVSPKVEDDAVHQILDLLKDRRGTDFSQYRPPTLNRRIRKRAFANGLDSLAAYHRFVLDHPAELDQLFDALLINVTEFFRDAEAWRHLQEQVIPDLAARQREGRQIRVWCAGCATGEEAYSIAMLLAEALPDPADWLNVKVFATDLDEKALAEARAGVYDAARLANVSPERLSRFFRPAGSAFEVQKRLRRMVIFGRHDLAKDPPIGRVDLIVCRNVLIYFDPPLQRRILSLFHYSLVDEGYLILGRSEAIPSDGNGFQPLEPRSRVFQKTSRSGHPWVFVGGESGAKEQREIADAIRESGAGMLFLPVLQQFLMEASYLVACVVDANMILRFCNRYARKVLGVPHAPLEGNSVFEVLPAFRKTGVKDALEDALASGRRMRIEAAEFSHLGRRIDLEIVIEPFVGPDGSKRALLVGQDVTAREEAREALRERGARLQETVEELQTTNEELQSANEELVTANEELQSANEELATLNEEFQSTNEELETTNEELQSTNEELNAVNVELARSSLRVDDLSRVLHSVIDVVDEAVVVCDVNEAITLWNPRAQSFFHEVKVEMIGRNIFSTDFAVPAEILRRAFREAAETHKPVVLDDVDLREDDGKKRQGMLKVFPLRDGGDGKAAGWVLACRDLTREHALQAESATGVAIYQALLKTTEEGFFVVASDGTIKEATERARRLIRTERGETMGRLWDLTKDPQTLLQLRGALADLTGSHGEAPGASAHAIPVTLDDGRKLHMVFVPVGSPAARVVLVSVTDETES